MLAFPSAHSPTRVAPATWPLAWLRRANKSQPPSSEPRTQVTDFLQNPQNPPHALPVHDVIHISGHILSLWDFYFDISERYILPARVNNCAQVCTKLTHVLNRKVLRLTKPKGKIYKMKSLGYYITPSDSVNCNTQNAKLFQALRCNTNNSIQHRQHFNIIRFIDSYMVSSILIKH